MSKLSDDKVAEYKEAFTLFDKDGDGCITTGEFGTVLRALGKSPTEAEIKTLIKEVDPDGRGIIDFPEFLSVLSRDIKNYDNEIDLRNAWKIFDKDNTGTISCVELKHVLCNIGEKLSPEEIEDLLKEADPDSDGKVQCEEFIRMMMAKA